MKKLLAVLLAAMMLLACVVPAMADEEAVYLHRYRQIRLPFVRTIEHHR